jgi:seryl-tRNA synthetase
MLDLKFLRENPEIVKQNIRNKFQDSKLGLVDEVIALDVELRNTKQEADSLRAERNKISKQIGGLMAPSLVSWRDVVEVRSKISVV